MKIEFRSKPIKLSEFVSFLEWLQECPIKDVTFEFGYGFTVLKSGEGELRSVESEN